MLQLNSTLTLVDIRVELVNETETNLTPMADVIADRGRGPNGSARVIPLPSTNRAVSDGATQNGQNYPNMARIRKYAPRRDPVTREPKSVGNRMRDVPVIQGWSH